MFRLLYQCLETRDINVWDTQVSTWTAFADKCLAYYCAMSEALGSLN